VLAILVADWSGNAYACTVSLATVQVSTSFRVFVRDGTSSLPGIQVEVFDQAELKSDSEWKPVLTLVTGRDGATHVQNLRPGTYLVATKGPGGGSAVYAQVSTEPRQPHNNVTLAWPFSFSSEILKVRTLAGRLESNNPWKPFENVHLELWTAGAEAPLAIKDTEAEGRFHFSEAKPGIYILRIHGRQKNVDDNWQVDGEIPLRLSPAAADSPEPLSLYLGMSSCGITYDSCPIPSALGLPSRRLQVRDPLGAVIAHAKYRVLDLAGAELATGSTDSDGIAELPSELKGKVTLVVASTGFTLFTLPLELHPPDDTASYLAVEMGVQGFGSDQCGAANLEKHATAQ
jgi:hypothetical protein